MTEQHTDSLEELKKELEVAIDELESTQDEISDLASWAERASHDLRQMGDQDRAAISKQASELNGQLRIIEGPEGLIEFGNRVEDSFSKPVEQSAVQGLQETIDALDLDLPENRIEDIQERVQSRTPSDLQNDAEAYRDAVKILQDEPDFTTEFIASEVDADEARYLIGPSNELTPLIEDIKRRRDTLEDLEDDFADAGNWVPDGLTALSEMEPYYAEYESHIQNDAIKTEVDTIDKMIAKSGISVAVAEVVKTDVETRLDGMTLPIFNTELNTVATKLETLSSNVEDTLDEITVILDLDTIPNSLESASIDLKSELEGFRSGTYQSLKEVLGAAHTVENHYQRFLDTVSDELDMLQTMCSQLADADEIEDLEPPTLNEPLTDGQRAEIREHPEVAFETVIKFREWVETAFDSLSEGFTGEEVSALFERLHTEDEVPISSIDVDTLRELQDTVPIIISLQR